MAKNYNQNNENYSTTRNSERNDSTQNTSKNSDRNSSKNYNTQNTSEKNTTKNCDRYSEDVWRCRSGKIPLRYFYVVMQTVEGGLNLFLVQATDGNSRIY